jgi:hypothetical protein
VRAEYRLHRHRDRQIVLVRLLGHGATDSEIKRDSVFLSGRAKLNADTNVFAEVVASRFAQTGRFAPAAQALALPLSDPKYAANVMPYLAQLGDPGQRQQGHHEPAPGRCRRPRRRVHLQCPPLRRRHRRQFQVV